MRSIVVLIVFFSWMFPLSAKVELGIDRLFQPTFISLVENKKVGLITNQTGVNGRVEKTLSIFEKEHENGRLELVAVFTPEHGFFGEGQAGKSVSSSKTKKGIPIYSLYGGSTRPTKEMLQGIDVLVFDIQDLGSRSYTYASTLLVCMEEAAKEKIEVVVLDRPNPLGGLIVDGPMVEENCRSFVSYVNVPYCYGMTIGELARFYNEEYRIGASLHVVFMKGWRRWMRFEETGLSWIPTSPNIPEASSSFFYPTTGLIGELSFVTIGGHTFPFKVVAAPWIDGALFQEKLNAHAPQGVRFVETKVRPIAGRFSQATCNGVFIVVTDWKVYKPLSVQFWILHTLKKLYPKELKQALQTVKSETSIFHKLIGSRSVVKILLNDPEPYTALCMLHHEEKKVFLKTRQKYLIPGYSGE